LSIAESNTGHRSAASYWRSITAPFCGADDRRSIVQLTLAATLFLASWTGAFLALKVSYLLAMLLCVPAACFVVMLFMIQHDCGHGSYFRSRRARDITGFIIGVITLTPYEYWRKTHAYHHAHSGDLDFRGFGDINTMTVAEYRAMSRWQRFAYRVYRHPITLLTYGPAFHFLVKHRYPWDIPHTREWAGAWRSVWMTNLALAAIVAVAALTGNLWSFLLIQIPVSLIASAIGVLLFYVQHQYEESYWHKHEGWDYYEAAIKGSSHLVLPRPLQWLTANIGLHHVHHLNSQIPNYKLEACLEASPELQTATRITMRDMWRLFWLTLWDEENRRMIRFRDLPTAGSATAPAATN
jgi:omega-6 fatty acid desaturase (delta-12 desaturase)